MSQGPEALVSCARGVVVSLFGGLRCARAGGRSRVWVPWFLG